LVDGLHRRVASAAVPLPSDAAHGRVAKWR
jgi:hypothetical protein